MVEPWSDGLIRHDVMSPEEIIETLSSGFSVNQGDVIKVLNPAQGGISYVLGFPDQLWSHRDTSVLNSFTC